MKKNIEAYTPNILERAIATIAPRYALKRHAARSALAFSGGYSGAGYSERNAYWRPSAGDADSDTVRDLKELRARSRDLVRNSPIGGGIIETQVTNVVGTGLTMQSRIDAEYLGMSEEQAAEWQKNTEREFNLWADSHFCDAFGTMNFYEIQSLAYRSSKESGDCFVILPEVRRNGWPFRLALQVIEADRVCNKDNKLDTDKLTAGIERDDKGAPLRVWIANRNPNSTLTTKANLQWSSVDFRSPSGRVNVIHLMRRLRAGQTRGVPELAPIIEIVKQLTRYSMAEVDAAVNSAAFALFVKMDAEVFQDVFDDDAQKSIIDASKRWDGSLRSGAAVNLLPGEEIQSAAMNRPNPNFDPFIQACLCQIGMAVNIPYEVITKRFNSSYSAARAALLDAWRKWRMERDAFASRFCQVVYEEWLADAVASGRISANGFFADPAIRKAWSNAAWSGDGMGAIDPLKEIQAASERMKEGVTTLPEEIIAYDGGDFDSKHREAVRVKKLRDEAGMNAQPQPSGGFGNPRAPSNPNGEDGDGGDGDE